MAGAARVSVVVPTHDRPTLLPPTLASVNAQRDLPAGVEVEIVLVDDGSQTTQAEQIARDHGARYLRHERSRGVSAARNTGIAAATGSHIAFLDDDDLWAPTKLARQLAALTERPAACWSATACIGTDGDLRVTHLLRMDEVDGALADHLLSDQHIPGGGSSVLVEAAALEAVGGFAEGVRVCEDWDLWIRLARHGVLAYVDEPLVAYRRWGGGASANLRLIHEGRAWIMDRHDAAHRLVPDHRDVPWLQWVGASEAAHGRRAGAARAYLAAARYGGGIGQLAYAGAAFASPRLIVRRLAQLERQQISPQVRATAEAWLAPYTAGG